MAGEEGLCLRLLLQLVCFHDKLLIGMKYISGISKTVLGRKARLPFYCLLALFFWVTACEEEEQEDQRMPTVVIDAIAEGDTLSMRWLEGGNTFDMVLADGAGLASCTVNIDSAGQNVFTITATDFQFRQEHKTIGFTGLAANYVYQVSVLVKDVNNHATTLNFRLLLTSAATPAFTYLGLVGDATPAGWNPGGSTAFVRDAANPFVFTYQGPLNAGEIKIATFLGDWCDGQWLNAAVADQAITSASYIVTNGCDGPDNKWRVQAAAAGNYLVTVNLAEETIVFQKL